MVKDHRQNHVMRQIVIVAQRWKHEMGPYNAARFLCSNSVPIKVALRVIVGENNMTREIDNALLMHGGEDDISIPGAALQQIIDDALAPDCGDMISQLRAQVAALTNERDELIDRNQHLADERDYYKKRANDMEERAMGKVYD